VEKFSHNHPGAIQLFLDDFSAQHWSYCIAVNNNNLGNVLAENRKRLDGKEDITEPWRLKAEE